MENDAEEGDDVLLATDRLVLLLSRDEEEDAEAIANIVAWEAASLTVGEAV